MCLFRLFFYEKYDWSNHSMMKCNFKKINNWTTTTYAPTSAFDYTTNGTSNGSWCMGIKGEMSGTVCVTFRWDMYIYIWVVYSLCLVCDLNRTPIVVAKHGGPWVHFSGISTCGRTSRDIVSHPQHPPLPTLCKISLPVYVIVTNERLQPLTTTWYNSPVLSFPLLKILRRLIKHRTFLRALHSLRERPLLCRRGYRLFHVPTRATSGGCLALGNKRSH